MTDHSHIEFFSDPETALVLVVHRTPDGQAVKVEIGAIDEEELRDTYFELPLLRLNESSVEMPHARENFVLNESEFKLARYLEIMPSRRAVFRSPRPIIFHSEDSRYLDRYLSRAKERYLQGARVFSYDLRNAVTKYFFYRLMTYNQPRVLKPTLSKISLSLVTRAYSDGAGHLIVEFDKSDPYFSHLFGNHLSTLSAIIDLNTREAFQLSEETLLLPRVSGEYTRLGYFSWPQANLPSPMTLSIHSVDFRKTEDELEITRNAPLLQSLIPRARFDRPLQRISEREAIALGERLVSDNIMFSTFDQSQRQPLFLFESTFDEQKLIYIDRALFFSDPENMRVFRQRHGRWEQLIVRNKKVSSDRKSFYLVFEDFALFIPSPDKDVIFEGFLQNTMPHLSDDPDYFDYPTPAISDLGGRVLYHLIPRQTTFNALLGKRVPGFTKLAEVTCQKLFMNTTRHYQKIWLPEIADLFRNTVPSGENE